VEPQQQTARSGPADPVRELHRRVAEADLDFSAVVRARREALGLSVEALATGADLDQERLRGIEDGSTPSLSELLLLCHALGLQVSIDSDLNLRVAALPAALAELDRLSRLPADWDSYGAEPPTEAAVVQARRIIEVVTPLLIGLAGRRGDPWAVAARVDGGIQIEWDGESGAVEVHVGPGGTLGYLIESYRDGELAYDEHEPVSLADVYEALVRTLVA
jgi:transcriptional regulator with XRE-family HTH domain